MRGIKMFTHGKDTATNGLFRIFKRRSSDI